VKQERNVLFLNKTIFEQLLYFIYNVKVTSALYNILFDYFLIDS